MNNPMTKVLVDSGFLIALFMPEDKEHDDVKVISELGYYETLIPDIVLPEVTYLLINRGGGFPTALTFLDSYAQVRDEGICLTDEDIKRAHEIMQIYSVDFVDCAIVALAERLNITTILTVDDDFRTIRPKHCEYFTLLPDDF